MKLVIAVNVVNDDGQIISSDIGHIDNPEQLSSSEVVNMTKQWVGKKFVQYCSKLNLSSNA